MALHVTCRRLRKYAKTRSYSRSAIVRKKNPAKNQLSQRSTVRYPLPRSSLLWSWSLSVLSVPWEQRRTLWDKFGLCAAQRKASFSVCVSMSWLTNKVWAANCLLAAGTGWLSINYSPSLNSWLAGLLYSLDSPCNILACTILRDGAVHIIPKPYKSYLFSLLNYLF